MAVDAAVPSEGESEFRERTRIVDVEADLLAQFTAQRGLRGLPRVDGAAEQPPVTGVENAGFLIAQLQKVASVVEHDHGGGGIGGPQQFLMDRKMVGHRARFARHRFGAAAGSLATATSFSMAASVPISRWS